MSKLMNVVSVGLLFLTSFAASSALAREFAGVSVADSALVEGKTLALNGAGLRKKFLFQVYVAALYLETPTHDGEALLAKDGIRQIEVHLLRDLSRKQITEAIRDGFQKNAGDRMGALQERLDKLLAQLGDLQKGSSFTVNYLPGRGTRLLQGQSEITLPGKDFADALFSVWLGKEPVDSSLKKSLLGL